MLLGITAVVYSYIDHPNIFSLGIGIILVLSGYLLRNKNDFFNNKLKS